MNIQAAVSRCSIKAGGQNLSLRWGSDLHCCRSRELPTVWSMAKPAGASD